MTLRAETPALRSGVAGLVALAAAGCYQSHRRLEGRDAAPEGGPRDAGAPDGRALDGRALDDAGPAWPRAVDLLFVLDNSISMAEEQRSLMAELPRLVSILVTGDFDQDGDGAGDGEARDRDFAPVLDLHLGVVTTDMGSGGISLPGCQTSRRAATPRGRWSPPTGTRSSRTRGCSPSSTALPRTESWCRPVSGRAPGWPSLRGASSPSRSGWSVEGRGLPRRRSVARTCPRC